MMEVADARAVATLLAVEAERHRALIAGDLPALERLFPDDLVHVHTTGAVHDKAALLHHVTAIIEFLSIERGDVTVRVYGDAAVMTGPMRSRVRARGGGEIVDVEAFVTQVWSKPTDGWRQASFHATRSAQR